MVQDFIHQQYSWSTLEINLVWLHVKIQAAHAATEKADDCPDNVNQHFLSATAYCLFLQGIPASMDSTV